MAQMCVGQPCAPTDVIWKGGLVRNLPDRDQQRECAKRSAVRRTTANRLSQAKRHLGNITGLSIQQTDLASKRLEILRELLPGLRTLAILVDTGAPNAVLERGEVQTAAHTLGLEMVTSEVRRVEDIAPAFDALKGRAEALYVCSSPLLTTNRIRVNNLALGIRVPTMYGFRDNIEAGGLMSYGPNLPSLFRRAADYVDKILRGAKPGDLPVEQPTKFDFIINLTTAKILGLEVPPSLVARADEVIE
jgi:putative tryptophan/tyrosine transport system substrate-binding protein